MLQVCILDGNRYNKRCREAGEQRLEILDDCEVIVSHFMLQKSYVNRCHQLLTGRQASMGKKAQAQCFKSATPPFDNRDFPESHHLLPKTTMQIVHCMPAGSSQSEAGTPTAVCECK